MHSTSRQQQQYSRASCLDTLIQTAVVVEGLCQLASLGLSDWSSVKSLLLPIVPGCVFTPELLPVSDLVRRGPVADAHLGLALWHT